MLGTIVKAGLLCVFAYYIYKSGFYEKVYIRVNKYIGYTKEYELETRKKKNYLRKLMKQGKHNEEM